jgi:hypothetical protein
MKYMYDMMGADHAGEHRHPQRVILELFHDAHNFVPQSLGDQWWFEATERTVIPEYIHPHNWTWPPE